MEYKAYIQYRVYSPDLHRYTHTYVHTYNLMNTCMIVGAKNDTDVILFTPIQ